MNEAKEGTCLAVVRIRGRVNVPRDIEDALKMLNLTRVFHATIVPNTPSYLGMLRKAKDYVTWGEASKDIVLRLLKERGELRGGKLTDDVVRDKLHFDSIEMLADSLYRGSVKMAKIGLKPVLRLHPPKKGFKKSIKRPYGSGGELGYRGTAINELLARMI